ncbi:ABC transporter ATP-binding protein [Haloplanus aerogenes]|uniref:ABC transporter ATP-binding protein n=1 Tax=Haloplanus aerogenes TaxID=660522 RepID=A0A3M0DSW8_9EURY|nr:ABC transporter ATP-binding protein [Haloplanus aerogenes]AZH24502.1 ABC transporter ATP-binding protein [Haloplanus aerogenes]RMB23850.1 branched-chain amino acid transport system ATP-binding protein [Haloplanus aerogenes]
MSDPILEVEDLRKTFGGIVAVDGATFDIERGSITGLIGPNGAGKTTTFNLISGFYEPDGGTVRYDGRNLQEIMRPHRDETVIWGGASGITIGALGGIVGLGPLGLSALPALGATVAGTAVGVGGYLAQQKATQRRPGHTNSRPYMLAREGLVRTFQLTRELGEMTALENLMLAPQGQAGENLANTWFRRDAVHEEEGRVRERAEEMLELLEIDHVRDEPAGNLSGGQRKLLELGRVLMLEPRVILLDEPVAGVNPSLTQKLMERIETLRDEGYTFCIVEHDMEVIMELSDTIIVMNEGKRLVEGPPEEIRNDEAVIDAYLGVG